ncbi:putative signal peptide protein [Desulfofarcimen acetoxidans DSM 771]|uniref:Putative signal peptide protein n=1 Tax=Desulfofarcimen acetoxidans (strain ATCC 49208 / DSM 771 / KCTC 5769 / VKM B-1644 / 5575) TaxID=485916 RepID=C8W272_DESAS|nr:DUF6765 family protein [Desulfofarcimen acetoxidans]ACV61736.1 putative signal peptide protein [Desulfofarcimen acetoxidans DSM 771]
MQIDFHHGVTYLLARLAGFLQHESEIIAYSSQYVDDATNNALVKLPNQAMYHAVRSAHKSLDYKNFDELSDHHVWIPYHFLPGNCSLPVDHGSDLNFASRLVCRANSYIARDMVEECIRRHNEPNALHRLGITMHVYADTWAHQGFAGIKHHVNSVKYLEDTDEWAGGKVIKDVANYFQEIFDPIVSKFVDGVIPLGHAAVLSYPDKPYLKWHYEDYRGTIMHRNNPAEYLDAAKNMFIAMKRFKLGDPEADVTGLQEKTANQLASLFQEINDENQKLRHEQWLEYIRTGIFSFERDGETIIIEDKIAYDESGPDSWEYNFLNTDIWLSDPIEIYNEFLDSNWKKFHDALKDHHYFLTRRLFPRYGLCVV